MSTTPIDVQAITNDIQSIGVAAIFREPFYGHILSGINKHVDHTLKQKQVTQIKPLGATTIAFSVHPTLWIKLNKEEKIARLKKEIMHYILMHPWAERPGDRGVFMTACDLSANKYAKDTLSLNIFNFGTLTKKYLKRNMLDEGYTDIYKDIKEIEKIVNSTLSDDDKLEFVAKALVGDFWDSVNKDQLTEAIFFLPKSYGGSMNMSGASQMVKSMKGASDEDISNAIKDLASDGDDPWEEVGKGTSDLGAKELIKNAFKDAKMRGDVPGDLSSYIDLFLAPPKIDWRQEVRTFTSTTGNVVAKTTMSKRSKRYKTFPAIKIQRTQRLAIIADSSGSVSDAEFSEFFNEMNGILAENCEIYFIQADANVDQIDNYKGRLPENMQVNRMGYGGTAFGPALHFVKTSGREQDRFPPIDKVDGVIYMTDGYAPAPEFDDYPFCKVLWLTTQKSVQTMESEGFIGRIVFLDIND
jgi:predicted metal-dependent peptidase